jgi:hypothetical protein
MQVEADFGRELNRENARSGAKTLANALQLEHSYTPDWNLALPIPGGAGFEPEVDAMCSHLAAVSLRLVQERKAKRQRLRIVR